MIAVCLVSRLPVKAAFIAGATLLTLTACSGSGQSATTTTALVTTTERTTATVVSTERFIDPTAQTVTVTATPAGAPTTSSSLSPTTAETTSTGSKSAAADDSVVGTTSGPVLTGPKPTFTARQGYIAKALGQEGGIASYDGSDTLVMKFVVDKIQPDFHCTAGQPERPENGHFIGIHVNVRVLPNFVPGKDEGFEGVSNDWRVVGPDDTADNDTSTAATYSCLAGTDALPSQNDTPGTKSSGWVVVDSKYTHGALLLNFAGPVDTGWEYHF